MHNSMPYDPIQGQGHRGPKVEKMADSKCFFSAGMYAIKRLMVDYDTPRQYLHFNCTDILYLSSFSVT